MWRSSRKSVCMSLETSSLEKLMSYRRNNIAALECSVVFGKVRLLQTSELPGRLADAARLMFHRQIGQDGAIGAVITRACIHKMRQRRAHFGQFGDLAVNPIKMLFGNLLYLGTGAVSI